MIRPMDVITKNPRVEHRELTSGEAVLLHLDTAAYHGMNSTGALIWTSIGEGATFEDLVAGVRRALDDPPARLEEDVAAFVESLVERDLLAVTAEGGAAAPDPG